MKAKKMPIVIQGGRLVDGNGGKPIEHATVFVEGNRIKRVAAGKMDLPQGVRVIDGSRKTILLGLIDNHVHYRDPNGELYLARGVTTVRDFGNPIDWILAQRDAIVLGNIAGPRIFCAGGGFYGKSTALHHMVADTPEEARRVTKRLIEMGVDYAKTHLGVSVEIIRAVAEEAHGAGFKVTGHLDSSILP